MTFTNYTDAVLSALIFNTKQSEVIAKKQEILDGVYRTENLDPTSVLFVGFNPAILSCKARAIAVTDISDHALTWLRSQRKDVVYIDPKDLVSYRKNFECVIAMDEYFTFAESDQEQQKKIATICSLATAFVISTVRDYKNQDFKDREFSMPAIVRQANATQTYLEAHDWDPKDRTRWISRLYEINEPTGSMKSYGPFERRTMFFKQLAKFSMDAGASNFMVHKNLMYKSLIKRNYEHVVSIQFD
jgi:hypothetical protein